MKLRPRALPPSNSNPHASILSCILIHPFSKNGQSKGFEFLVPSGMYENTYVHISYIIHIHLSVGIRTEATCCFSVEPETVNATHKTD